MAASGPIPKLMLFLDLDETHFDSHRAGVAWLGQEKDWLAFYHELIQVAQQQGVELLFGVVTNKPNFDDIAEQAAVSFKDLLSIRNPDMYFDDEEGLRWCLVTHDQSMVYECINYQPVGDEAWPFLLCENNKQPSHFVIVPLKNKSDYMLEIATYHGIAPECCLLLDDTPNVILDATLHGIQTISFDAFCSSVLEEEEKPAHYEKLKDPNFVEPILQAKRQQIRHKLQQMIEQVLAKQAPTEKASVPIPKETLLPNNMTPEAFLELKRKKDPEDCLHSWGSFRLQLGIPLPAANKEPAKSVFKPHN